MKTFYIYIIVIIYMILTDNLYYILRVGDFATNANTKLYYSAFTTLLCIDDYFSNQSSDCFAIMLYSTFAWSLIEFFLHISNTRVIKPMVFYFFQHRYKLSNYLGIFLQGFQEGGCVTTIGLYFGDRLFVSGSTSLFYFSHSFVYLHLLIFFIVCNVAFKQRINNCNSKRLVNANSSIVLMSAITLYNCRTLYLYPEHVWRQLKMLFVMVYVCSFWTLAVWYKGFRMVEVYKKNNFDLDIIQRHKGFDTFYVLAYDVFFEIGMAYMFFYNILIFRTFDKFFKTFLF